MSESLPVRPNLEWLKKVSKERLDALRAADPNATLSDAQLAVARQYGFPSWRKLKAHVELVRQQPEEVLLPSAGSPVDAATVPPDDADLVQLFAAIDAGDMKVISQLLGRRPEMAKARGTAGQTPLHAAAQNDDPRLCMLLLACGADPNATFGDSGHTPLSWAVTCNAMSFAGAMVRLGHKPDLYCAAGMGSLGDVKACFDDAGDLRPGAARTGSSRFDANGARLPCPPQTAVEQVSDALYIAARNAQADVVNYLLTKQPDLSFRAFMGGTPLHWAYAGGSRAVVDMLHRAGADPTVRDDVLRCTPRAFGIFWPASVGFLFLVRPRVSEDPSLVRFMDGRTSALHEAARGGHDEVVCFLLEHGADPALRDGDGRIALDLAIERGHAQVAAMLRSAPLR